MIKVTFYRHSISVTIVGYPDIFQQPGRESIKRGERRPGRRSHADTGPKNDRFPVSFTSMKAARRAKGFDQDEHT